MYDIIIQNAVIIDGTGLPAYRADIAIKGDRIAAIGKLDAKAKQTIKARAVPSFRASSILIRTPI